MSARPIAGIALACSLALNAYLLLAPPPVAPAVLAPPPPETMAPTQDRAPVVEPVVATDDRALRQRIAEVEADITKYEPPDKAWAKLPRSPELEQSLQPAFDDRLSATPYTLECRGRICKVMYVDHHDGWQQSLTDPVTERHDLPWQIGQIEVSSKDDSDYIELWPLGATVPHDR